MPPKTKTSNAENMRRYRARKLADPAAHEEYKRRERERYQRRKEAGKIPTIRNLTPRQQRSQRRKWRLEKRLKRKGEDSVNIQEETTITPPQTPPPEPSHPVEPPQQLLSHQKIAGRRKIRRESRKAYRTINQQKETIERLNKEIKVLKRKIRKAHQKTALDETEMSEVFEKSSPSTKAESVLKSGDRTNVKKHLTFGFAICDQVKEKLKLNARRHKEKQVLHRMFTGKLIKKYRLIDLARKQINLTQREIKKAAETTLGTASLLQYVRKQTVSQVADVVRSFFMQDVNSSPAAGKRETITRGKVKMQKRYLCDTMINLHKKFQSENPSISVSYTSFTRMRPFYVVPPKVNNRETVKCKIHHNCELKALKLHQIGVLAHKDPYSIISDIVCDVNKKDCMYQQCEICRPKWANIYKDNEKKESSETITYFEWQREEKKVNSHHGQSSSIHVVNKVEKTASVSAMCKRFEQDLALLMPHQYRISHQYQAIKDIKQDLQPHECVLQIDFSESYACKAETEIQAMHFGGSRKQISVHTCHATFTDGVQCYCTVSEDLRHSAESVWAHLSPVLDDTSDSGKTVLHFLSDGPTTQYRNKTNFFLLATLPFNKWNFKSITYNFLEAGHGKGPADGIGAAVKSCADRLVAHGEDILDTRKFVELVSKNVSVKMYEITAEDVNAIQKIVTVAQPQTITGTMKIHQLMASRESEGTLYHRSLSCFCMKPKFCACYDRSDCQIKCTTNATVAAIELKLDANTQTKFHRRLQEGYDVTLEDLTNLDEQDRKEYILWKTWRAAKLQGQEKAETASTCQANETMDISESESDAEEEMDSLWEPSSGKGGKNQPRKMGHKDIAVEVHSYYAVFFYPRNSRKGTFYIGRALDSESDSEMTTFKFLERKYGSQNKYDWPRRDDISTIDNRFILSKVEFDGPPPFFLNDSQLKMIQRLVVEFRLL